MTPETVDCSSLFDLLSSRSAAHPESAALITPEQEQITYLELHRWLRSSIALLREAGVSPASRIAVCMPPGPEAALAMLATMSCATCVPIDAPAMSAEPEAALRSLRVDFLLALENGSVDSLPVSVPRLSIRTTRNLGPVNFEIIATNQWVSPPDPHGHNRSGEIALLLQTSGTTSKPKLVPLSHSNILASAQANARCFGLGPGDRCLNVLPLNHIGGLVHGLLTTLVSGGSVVCLRGFVPESFARQVADFSPSWFTGTPAIQRNLLPFIEDYRRLNPGHRFRFLRSASAPIPVDMIARLEQAFGAPLIEGYGMTEAGRIACNPLPPARRKPGSVGVPVALEVQIASDDGSTPGPGIDGEILIRGASVMSGYADGSADNTLAFSRGWFRTGDLGHFDDEGYLYITGRLKEMINRGGEKIAPAEIDEALCSLAGVAEAAAFGIPHPSLGEDLAAAVVSAPGISLEPDDLRRQLLQYLPRSKVPSRIFITDSLPRGRTGKVLRGQLTSHLGSPCLPACGGKLGKSEALVSAAVGRILGLKGPGRDDNFFQIGGDSLSALRLASVLTEAFLLMEPLNIRTIFEHPVIRNMAAELDRISEACTAGMMKDLEGLSADQLHALLSREVTSAAPLAPPGRP